MFILPLFWRFLSYWSWFLLLFWDFGTFLLLQKALLLIWYVLFLSCQSTSPISELLRSNIGTGCDPLILFIKWNLVVFLSRLYYSILFKWFYCSFCSRLSPAQVCLSNLMMMLLLPYFLVCSHLWTWIIWPRKACKCCYNIPAFHSLRFLITWDLQPLAFILDSIVSPLELEKKGRPMQSSTIQLRIFFQVMGSLVSSFMTWLDD